MAQGRLDSPFLVVCLFQLQARLSCTAVWHIADIALSHVAVDAETLRGGMFTFYTLNHLLQSCIVRRRSSGAAVSYPRVNIRLWKDVPKHKKSGDGEKQPRKSRGTLTKIYYKGKLYTSGTDSSRRLAWETTRRLRPILHMAGEAPRHHYPLRPQLSGNNELPSVNVRERGR